MVSHASIRLCVKVLHSTTEFRRDASGRLVFSVADLTPGPTKWGLGAAR